MVALQGEEWVEGMSDTKLLGRNARRHVSLERLIAVKHFHLITEAHPYWCLPESANASDSSVS